MVPDYHPPSSQQLQVDMHFNEKCRKGEGGRACRMRARACWLGMPSAISRSKRPARRSAASSASGRFVAPAGKP